VRRVLIWFVFILIFMLISSCNIANKAPDNNLGGSAKQLKKTETERVPQTAPEPKRDESPDAIAKRLVKIAVKIPQVNDATAIVAGKYAIVGIDVEAKLDRSRVGTIKYSVAEALKEDPIGATSLVTADPDLLQRLREIKADMDKGRPIKGIAEELADIAGRIIPQAPRAVQEKEDPPKPRDETREPNDRLKSIE